MIIKTTGVLVNELPSNVLIDMLSGILKKIIENNGIEINDVVFNKLLTLINNGIMRIGEFPYNDTNINRVLFQRKKKVEGVYTHIIY